MPEPETSTAAATTATTAAAAAAASITAIEAEIAQTEKETTKAIEETEKAIANATEMSRSLSQTMSIPWTDADDSNPKGTTFVNNGLKKWQDSREKWTAKPHSDTNEASTTTPWGRKAVPIDVDEVIDVLFDPRWRGGKAITRASLEPPRFPKNVPLPQMIDVLTDLWEAEGLDV